MATAAPNKWAVLIGVEYYDHPGQPATTPRLNHKGELIKFNSLEGCVNDVLDVEEYLKEAIGVPAEHITKLLSPSPGHPRLVNRSDYGRPTYQNIIKALKDVGINSRRSRTNMNGGENKDFVYIHFSGHGAITSTIFPVEWGDANATDEALVPCDITLGGLYLRDLELAALLEDLVAQECVVTVVLDCCHSGGAIRGEDDDERKTGLTRGIEDHYISDPIRDKCQEKERIDFWIQSNPSWIDAPRGFVVLTACLALEKAKESRTNPRHGVLTDCLLRCLRNSAVDIPSQALFEGLRSAVQNVNSFQTPDLIGDNERFFFSKEVRRKTYALRVGSCKYVNTALPRASRKVVLEGGSMHGVELGYGYDIYRKDFDLSQPMKDEDVIAKVIVKKVDDYHSEAWFRYFTDKRHDPLWGEISIGCPAVLNRVPVEKQSTIRFLAPDDTLLAAFQCAWEESLSKRIQLRLVDTKYLGAVFTISINKSGNFSISDASNMINPAMEQVLDPLPAIPATSMKQSVPQLITRLEHLARYKTTRGLGTVGTVGANSSSIATSITCEITSMPEGTPRLKFGGESFPWASEDQVVYEKGVWSIPEDMGAGMVLRNVSDRPLSVVVLSWSAELDVTKLWPTNNTHKIIYPEQKPVEIGIVPSVGPEMRPTAEAGGEIIDVHKIFVSEKPMVLTALLMESLDEKERFGLSRGAEETQWQDLEDLLGDLDITRATRAGDMSDEPKSATWGVVDVKVRVIPRQALDMDDVIEEE